MWIRLDNICLWRTSRTNAFGSDKLFPIHFRGTRCQLETSIWTFPRCGCVYSHSVIGICYYAVSHRSVDGIGKYASFIWATEIRLFLDQMLFGRSEEKKPVAPPTPSLEDQLPTVLLTADFSLSPSPWTLLFSYENFFVNTTVSLKCVSTIVSMISQVEQPAPPKYVFRTRGKNVQRSVFLEYLREQLFG